MALSVLVVDDEQAICDNLAAYLEDEGMRVYTAHSGEEAIEHLRAGLLVQICVVDLRLPGMSGTDTMLEVRRLAPGMAFIIHTGSADDAVTAALRRSGLGRIPVFRKPVTDMAALVQTLLAHATGPG
jgi:two-component system OmpR family response regulator